MLLQIPNFLKAYQRGAPKDDNGTVIGIIVLVVVVIIFIILIAVNSKGGKGSTGKGLKRLAKEHGLDHDQLNILKKAVKQFHITNAPMLFSNGRYLNSILKKLMVQIENSNYTEGQKESLKGEFFEIKRLITVNHQSGNHNLTTKNIANGQEVTIFSRTFPPLHSTVSGKTAEFVVLDHPADSHGELFQFKQGSAVKIRFIRDEEKVFSFVTSIAEMHEIEGTPKLLLPHTAKVQRMQLRRNERREFNKTTYFYKVNIVLEGKGRKQVKRALVDQNKRYSGTFADISAGGCGIITRSALPKNSPIMLTFDFSTNETLKVFGRVRGLRKQRNGVILMHIAFSSIPLKTLNKINTYVYDMDDDQRTKSILNKVLLD